jgi:DNA-binding SARP family transcriptional activator
MCPLCLRRLMAGTFSVEFRSSHPRPTIMQPTETPYFLTLFDSVELRGRDGRSHGTLLANTKAVGLLAYLSVPALGRFVRRDRVVGLLWPELDQTRARTALRKTVHAIRRDLGSDSVLSRGDEEIALSPDVLTCDAAEFTRAAETGLLLKALQLYRGELLSGFHLRECWEFDRWLEEERTDARERAAAAAWALAQRMESDQHLSDAAGMARRSVRIAWTDERALRRALMMLERLGDRAGALRLYDEFARRLRAELETDPSPDTVELATRLRSAPVQ